MEKGTLVEFRVQGERRLGVIDRPEGKKDWIVIDQGGNPHKLRPQRFDYIIKAGPSNYKEIGNFLREVQPYLDPSGLEVAWELLAGENQLVTPETMAEFKAGLEILRQAHIYAQRIDWLMSGDDGEDSFHRRLKHDLEKL